MATLISGRGEGWQAAEIERIAILRASGVNLTNLTDGGDGTPGVIPTKSQREALSKQRKGKPLSREHRVAMTGWRHTAETRLRIAAASATRRHSAATRAAMAEKARGRDMTTQVRASAVARAGTRLSLEHRAKIASRITNRQAAVCVETGIIYPSITAAALALGVSEASVYQAIHKGGRCKGNHYRIA